MRKTLVLILTVLARGGVVDGSKTARVGER